MLDNLVVSPPTGASDRTSAPRPRRIRLTVLSFGLAAFAMSVAGSWIPSYWGDEAASILSAERPLPSLFMMLGNVDAVHGTYYLMMHFWIAAFGTSSLLVRLPSAVAIGFAVAGVVALGHRLGGRHVAVFAGVVALLLPRLTLVGMEARSYAFSAAFAVWLTLLLVVLLERRDRRAVAWAVYAALAAASAYMFLFSLLIVVAHGVIVVSSHGSRRMLRPWLIASGAAVVLAGPVIVWGFLERRQISYLFQRDAASPYTVAVDQWFGNVGYAILAWGILAAAIVVGVTVWRRGVRLRRAGGVVEQPVLFARRTPTTPRTVVVAGAVALVPFAILWGANALYPVYTDRYLAMAAPAVALLLGWLLAIVPWRRAGVAGLVLLTLAALPSYVYQRTPFAKNESDWAEFSDVIQDHARVGDAVVFDESVQPSRRPRLALNTYPQAYVGLRDITLKSSFQNNTTWWDTTYTVGAVADRFTDVQRVWVVEYHLPGTKPDSYGMASLRSLGYHVQASWPGHRSVVYEMTRGA